MQRLHWRQLVVLGEVLLLFLVGFLPQEQNLLANAIVSFSCAMQVQAFRKVNGYAFASTMCIGDLRSGVEALCVWSRTRDPKAKDRMLRYFGIILLFALGSGIGSKSCVWLGGRTIWISCGLLLVSFALMFIREDLEENPVIKKRPCRDPAGDPGDRPRPPSGAAGTAAGIKGERRAAPQMISLNFCFTPERILRRGQLHRICCSCPLFLCKNHIAAMCRILFTHPLSARIISTAIERCKRESNVYQVVL